MQCGSESGREKQSQSDRARVCSVKNKKPTCSAGKNKG